MVYAGLVPWLRSQGNWQITSFRPGEHPFRSLAGALLPLLEPKINETERLVQATRLEDTLRRGELALADVVGRVIEKGGESQRLLLLVDQFEEMYTLCPDPDERRRFLDQLLGILQAGTRSP